MKNSNAHAIYVNALKKGYKVAYNVIENEAGKQTAVVVKVQLNALKVLFVKCHQNGNMLACGYNRHRVTRQKGGKWVTIGFTKYGKRDYEEHFKTLEELYKVFPSLK